MWWPLLKTFLYNVASGLFGGPRLQIGEYRDLIFAWKNECAQRQYLLSNINTVI